MNPMHQCDAVNAHQRRCDMRTGHGGRHFNILTNDSWGNGAAGQVANTPDRAEGAVSPALRDDVARELRKAMHPSGAAAFTDDPPEPYLLGADWVLWLTANEQRAKTADRAEVERALTAFYIAAYEQGACRLPRTDDRHEDLRQTVLATEERLLALIFGDAPTQERP